MKYFLINYDNDTYTIKEGPMSLPFVFKNTSNFNLIERSDPSLLKNLSWAGSPDLGFWQAVYEDKPKLSEYQILKEFYSVNEIDKTVAVSYGIVDLPKEEIERKKSSKLEKIRAIRNLYLKNTDFTQLPDAPLSKESQQEFRVFRQQLRDLVNLGNESVENLVWPVIPKSSSNVFLDPFPNF